MFKDNFYVKNKSLVKKRNKKFNVWYAFLLPYNQQFHDL